MILSQAAKTIVDTIKYITVATVNEEGAPWNTPIAAVHDEDCSFYWASWGQNQHSHNIRANGKAFIVIYDSTPENGPTQGVYIKLLRTKFGLTTAAP